MKKYESKYAYCPFYHGEDKTKIYCEGITEGSHIHNVFSTSEKMKAFRNTYCCQMDKYKDCLLYKPISQKYKRSGFAGL